MCERYEKAACERANPNGYRQNKTKQWCSDLVVCKLEKQGNTIIYPSER